MCTPAFPNPIPANVAAIAMSVAGLLVVPVAAPRAGTRWRAGPMALSDHMSEIGFAPQ